MDRNLVEKLSDHLASHSSRRTVLRFAARLTGVVAAAGTGLVRFARDAQAVGCGLEIACCCLGFDRVCSTQPFCPEGSRKYSWLCCYSGDSCVWECVDCAGGENGNCSFAYIVGSCGPACDKWAPAA